MWKRDDAFNGDGTWDTVLTRPLKADATGGAGLGASLDSTKAGPSRATYVSVPSGRSDSSNTLNRWAMRRYASRILLALRDGEASDWSSLCAAFEVRPRMDSDSLGLLQELRDLRAVGLISVEEDGEDGRFKAPRGRIRLTPYWNQLQAALGLSLSDCARLQNNGMAVTPLFGRPGKASGTDIFVIMPFSPKLQPVYKEHIVPLAERLGLSVARADDLFTTHSVMSDIWRSIVTSKVVLADCTERNPNVFYELGIAHTVGKPVILTTQSPDDVPFDIRHIRYLPYSYTPSGMRDFESALARTLRGLH